MRQLIIAHRGASVNAPENTIAAFKKAICDRAHFIETDIQLTKDFVPVLFHDEQLTRTINSDLKISISDMNYSELNQLSAGKWFNQEFESEKVPTLRQLLTLDEEIGLMLEIKETRLDPHKVVEIIFNEVNSVGSKKAPIFFATSDTNILAELIAQVPMQTIMGIAFENQQIESYVSKKILHLAVDYKLINRHNLTLIPESCQLWAWTVNDTEIALSLKKMRVIGIITDNPEKMKNFIYN